MDKTSKIICYVCQDYRDHPTSKCPNIICKECGQKGHAKKNCPLKNTLSEAQGTIEQLNAKLIQLDKVKAKIQADIDEMTDQANDSRKILPTTSIETLPTEILTHEEPVKKKPKLNLCIDTNLLSFVLDVPNIDTNQENQDGCLPLSEKQQILQKSTTESRIHSAATQSSNCTGSKKSINLNEKNIDTNRENQDCLPSFDKDQILPKSPNESRIYLPVTQSSDCSGSKKSISLGNPVLNNEDKPIYLNTTNFYTHNIDYAKLEIVKNSIRPLIIDDDCQENYKINLDERYILHMN